MFSLNYYAFARNVHYAFQKNRTYYEQRSSKITLAYNLLSFTFNILLQQETLLVFDPSKFAKSFNLKDIRRAWFCQVSKYSLNTIHNMIYKNSFGPSFQWMTAIEGLNRHNSNCIWVLKLTLVFPEDGGVWEKTVLLMRGKTI